MSQKQHIKPGSPAPAPTSSDEVRIGHVRFVNKAMSIIPIAGRPATAIEEYINARRSSTEDGYDIAWVPARRAFRFERFVNGARVGQRWVHETRMEIWEDLQDVA